MPGTNDFVQHNPTEANQEPNGTFAADSLTTGGIGTDAIMPSPWMNARWYQDSTVCAALMQTLANKGYNVSVANLATLISVMTGALVTEADLRTPLVTVGYSPTPTFPASTANGFDIVLGGNVTSSAFDVAPNIGQILTFIVTQTAGGGATFVPPASVNGWKPIGTNANEVTVQQFIVREDGTIRPLNPLPIIGTLTVGVVGPLASNTGVTYNINMSDIVPAGKTVNVSIAQGSTFDGSGGGVLFRVQQIAGNVVTLIFVNNWNSPQGFGPCTFNLSVV